MKGRKKNTYTDVIIKKNVLLYSILIKQGRMTIINFSITKHCLYSRCSIVLFILCFPYSIIISITISIIIEPKLCPVLIFKNIVLRLDPSLLDSFYLSLHNLQKSTRSCLNSIIINPRQV